MNKTILLALLALAACANQSKQEPAPEHPATVEPTVRQQFPMRVSWEERSLTPTSAVIAAHIERMNALSLPFLVRVELPPGVKVLRGNTKFELLPNNEAVETVEVFELAFEQLPTTNAVLRVDGDSQAMGFHSTQEYRFGRGEPETPRPYPTGPAPAGKGGKSLGGSVPIR